MNDHSWGRDNHSWGRAAITARYDSDWFQKGAQFWGYNDVFGGKKSAIGITHGQSEKTLHCWAGLASHAQMSQKGIPTQVR